MNNKISLKDIAELAGVTKMTVSRYIRTPEKVSKETAKAISDIIEEINYVPKRAPGIQLNAQSFTIGVLIPSFQNQIFADILAGIESVTSGNKYQPLIANFNYSKESEEEVIINLLSYNIDGIILTEKLHTQRTMKFLRAAKIPIVETMDISGDRLDMAIGFDNRQAAFDMVTTMLRKRLRQHIVYLGSKNDPRDEQRYQGYSEAMRQRGLQSHRVNPQSISSVNLGSTLMKDTLEAFPQLDGVFCSNDDIAVGALMFCQENNISVPDEVAIAGFHGLEIGRQLRHHLSTIITPRFHIGRTAASMLISKLKNDVDIPSTVDMGYQVYEGATI